MTLVIIPARINSTRLPGKPLLKIGDKTIIERCVRQAQAAGFDPIVATDSIEILDLESIDHAILTPECATGTDRVAWAAEKLDPEGKHKYVINYQGDMPFLDPQYLQSFVEFREKSSCEILTAYAMVDYVEPSFTGHFSRSTIMPHIGLYGFTRAALRKFAATPHGRLERVISLEQCRGVEYDEASPFIWEHFELPSMPIEINTQADLDRARSCLM